MNDMPPTRHQVTRVRRESRRRVLRVASIEQLTPQMRRIHFASSDLDGFESLGVDDHIKLFIPNSLGANGKPCMRDYTPRAYDAAQGSVTIDFALHQAGNDAGPATAWALAAKPGDELEIGGPRGSMVVPDDFDWYLLIGDETALPSIGRRLEGLRAGVPVKTIVLIGNDADRQEIATKAAWDALWISREGAGQDDPALLLAALKDCGELPEGDGYVWIAAEAQVARTLRAHVLDTLQHPKTWLRASGYWMLGEADAHVNLEA